MHPQILIPATHWTSQKRWLVRSVCSECLILWQMNILIYLWPQNLTNICRMNIFVYKYSNVPIYLNVYNANNLKIYKWRSEYIFGPKIKQIFWTMNIFVNNYPNIFEYPNICCTLGQIASRNFLHLGESK